MNDDYLVYFLLSGRFVKIGFTRNLQGRMRTLSTGSSVPLQVLCLFECKDEVSARTMEKRFHDAFSAAKTNGEWFSAKTVINTLLSQPSALTKEQIHMINNAGRFVIGEQNRLRRKREKRRAKSARKAGLA